MKKTIVSLCSLWLLLLPSLLTAGGPFISLDFHDIEDGVVESAERNYALRLGEHARLRADGPTGKPYVEFDGTPGSAVRVDPRRSTSRFKGDEVSLSMWFRLDRVAKCDIAYGFFHDGLKPLPWGHDFGETHLRYNAKLEKTDFDAYRLWSWCEGTLATGVWHHVAMTYSMTNLQFNFWYDGRLQRGVTTDQDLPRPIAGFLSLPMANGFHGALSDIRIWNRVVSSNELMTMGVSRKMAEDLAARYEAACEAVPACPNTTPFREWCVASARRARAFGARDKGDVREWAALQQGRDALPYLSARMEELSASSDTGLERAPVLPISIYPYHMNKRLPWILPADGKSPGNVAFAAALGEYESASVMLFPFRDVGAFHVVPTTLTGPEGAVIPASAVDVRVVKCWFTPRGGWNTYFGGGREFGTLSPEILLHDDAFIKVDRDKRANYVRCSYPAGDRYIWTSRYGTAEDHEALNYEIEPMHDADSFQPLSLVQGELRQLWITLEVPRDAKGGHYTGELVFSEDGKPTGALPLSVEVHGFPLPRAATRYNIDQPFYGTWMHGINLDVKVKGGENFSNAVRRLRSEYRNMAAHNMIHPWTMSYGNTAYPDFADVQLDLMEETGLATKPIFSDISGCNYQWASMFLEKKRFHDEISVESNLQYFAETSLAFSNRVAKALNRLERKLGHRDVFCAGWDEAGPEVIRRQMPGFMTIRRLGGRPFITMGIAKWAAYAVGADDVPGSFGRTHAQAWHAGGALATTYAAPFSGPENPECWRRNKGIRLYSSNFDGCNEYQWYGGIDVWNDFIYSDRYKTFCIVYPTADGVLDTVAWEALREGYDDVRYLTLLRRLARVAMQSGRRPLLRLGRSATAWAVAINPETVDLDAMRAESARWIDRLHVALDENDVSIPESVYR